MEDAIVHDQNTNLGPAHVPNINDLADEEISGNIGHMDWTNGGSVITNALSIHGQGDCDDDPIPELE